jgi:HSP20 family protein
MAHLAIQNDTPVPGLFDDLKLALRAQGRAFGESGVVGEFAPAFEVRETRSELRIHADVPGVTARNLSVCVEGRRLIVCGRRERGREQRELCFHAYERTYGTFWRTFRLNEQLDLENARAVLQRGVLTISIPKRARRGAASRREAGAITVHSS